MSPDTFAWSGALRAQLREEGTEVIFPPWLSPSVSALSVLLSFLCISLSSSQLWSHPTLSLSLCLILLSSAVSEIPWVRQQETITLTDRFALLQFLSVLVLSPLPLFLYYFLLLAPPVLWRFCPLLFISSIGVNVCIRGLTHRSSNPLSLLLLIPSFFYSFSFSSVNIIGIAGALPAEYAKTEGTKTHGEQKGERCS